MSNNKEDFIVKLGKAKMEADRVVYGQMGPVLLGATFAVWIVYVCSQMTLVEIGAGILDILIAIVVCFGGKKLLDIYFGGD